MKPLAIKKWVVCLGAGLMLGLGSVQVQAFSMSEMVGQYTSSTVSPNSRASKNSRRGFMSGGSARVRFENKEMPELYNVTMPSFSADCNGMDMNLGALSWISGDEFLEAARAMASPQVLIYALSLALNQMCGPCAQEMKNLQDELNKYQNMLKGSCEEIGTALYEKTPLKRGSAWVHDQFWADAQEDSGNDAAATQGNVAKDLIDSGSKEKMNGNSVWDHLAKMDTVGGYIEAEAGTEVAKQLIMSLSGTLVYNANNATNDSEIVRTPWKPAPPTLKSIVEGEEILGLRCMDADCLEIEHGAIDTLDPLADTFFKMLDPARGDSIPSKFAVHESSIVLTDTETAFLDAASKHVDIVPLIRKLALTGRTMQPKVATFISEWMAIEIGLAFMLDYIETGQAALGSLENRDEIPEVNIFELRENYRAEARTLRQELEGTLSAEADINSIIASIIAASK